MNQFTISGFQTVLYVLCFYIFVIIVLFAEAKMKRMRMEHVVYGAAIGTVVSAVLFALVMSQALVR